MQQIFYISDFINYPFLFKTTTRMAKNCIQTGPHEDFPLHKINKFLTIETIKWKKTKTNKPYNNGKK